MLAKLPKNEYLVERRSVDDPAEMAGQKSTTQALAVADAACAAVPAESDDQPGNGDTRDRPQDLPADE